MAERPRQDRKIDALEAMAAGGRRREADLASEVESAARDDRDVDISGEIAAVEEGSTADLASLAGAATGDPMSAADAAEAAEAAVGIGPAVDPVQAAPVAAIDADGPDQIALAARLAGAAAPARAADASAAASQRRAEYEARRRMALAVQFRKTMIPVIVMVALILALLAGGLLMVVSPLVTGRVGEETTLGWIAASPLVQAHGKALAVASLAVAGILLAGCWKFQADVRRSRKQ